MERAYKLFRMKNGKLYPLYVLADQETKIGTWLPAQSGEIVNGKVKSRLGQLAYRPGWHLADAPYAPHIYKKGADGKRYMHDDQVWVECLYSDEINYQPLANEHGRNKDGKIIAKNACLKEIPKNGFYRYKTSPQMHEDWIIAGSIKVVRVLSDEEVARICRNKGYEPMPRERRTA